MAVRCASVSRWACRKRRRENSPCMRVDALVMAGENNVLIVSVLLPIAIDLALRSNMQRRVGTTWSRRYFRISTSPRRWPALAVTPFWVRIVCVSVTPDFVEGFLWFLGPCSSPAVPCRCGFLLIRSVLVFIQCCCLFLKIHWVSTVCPAVWKRGAGAPTIQSCALVAPE